MDYEITTVDGKKYKIQEFTSNLQENYKENTSGVQDEYKRDTSGVQVQYKTNTVTLHNARQKKQSYSKQPYELIEENLALLKYLSNSKVIRTATKKEYNSFNEMIFDKKTKKFRMIPMPLVRQTLNHFGILETNKLDKYRQRFSRLATYYYLQQKRIGQITKIVFFCLFVFVFGIVIILELNPNYVTNNPNIVTETNYIVTTSDIDKLINDFEIKHNVKIWEMRRGVIHKDAAGLDYKSAKEVVERICGEVLDKKNLHL
jgi:hypothetical protein